MAGSKEPAYAELFLRERPGTVDPAILEPRLREMAEKATRAWPDLAIDPARFVIHLARVSGDDFAQGLAEVFAEDLALGLACVEQAPGALMHVERLCGPAIDAAVARIDRSPELRDEVRQTLWQRLFVGTPGQAARILSYAGRGPLVGWIAVAAQRIALDLRRAATRAAGSDPVADQLLPSEDHPEVDYLRNRYKTEFEAAVRDALAALPDRDRLLLRLTTVSGLSHEQIAAIYKVNQSTVTRWISHARAEVLEATERIVCGKLGVQRDEFMSLAGLLVSRIDLSISRVLETSSPE
ncbi:MAG TPA: sigma-70 family RNA polymerase sigma factor [Polyangia bacterium]|jgi:RNA polymerase sigma-70 factor (ECF subfamily)|nr:sigma-70 family RNA polymerase sigma factor [Polyangia bacterium]